MAATLFSVTAHVTPGMTGKARDYDSVSVGVYSSRERAAAAAELYAAKWCDPASGALARTRHPANRWSADHDPDACACGAHRARCMRR
jgi:hypothetical protein